MKWSASRCPHSYTPETFDTANHDITPWDVSHDSVLPDVENQAQALQAQPAQYIAVSSIRKAHCSGRRLPISLHALLTFCIPALIGFVVVLEKYIHDVFKSVLQHKFPMDASTIDALIGTNKVTSLSG